LVAEEEEEEEEEEDPHPPRIKEEYQNEDEEPQRKPTEKMRKSSCWKQHGCLRPSDSRYWQPKLRTAAHVLEHQDVRIEREVVREVKHPSVGPQCERPVSLHLGRH
jgi:hypothetical protein